MTVVGMPSQPPDGARIIRQGTQAPPAGQIMDVDATPAMIGHRDFRTIRADTEVPDVGGGGFASGESGQGANDLAGNRIPEAESAIIHAPANERVVLGRETERLNGGLMAVSQIQVSLWAHTSNERAGKVAPIQTHAALEANPRS